MKYVLFFAIMVMASIAQDATAITWGKTQLPSNTKRFLTAQVEKILSDNGFTMVARNADIEQLLTENTLTMSGLLDTNIELVGSISSVRTLVTLSVDTIKSASYLVAKMYSYPRGELMGASEPIELSGDYRQSTQTAVTQMIGAFSSKSNRKLANRKLEKGVTPIWAKIAGYASLGLMTYGLVELNSANSSYTQHKGSVNTSTANSTWDDYTTHRNRALALLGGSLAMGVTWSLGL